MTSDTTTPTTVDENARQQFEAAWHAGRPEPIERFLPPPAHPAYLATLEELVHIELEFAWKRHGRPAPDAAATAARPPRVEDYLARFPGLRQTAVIARLVGQEYRVRNRHGDRPTLAEYRDRFPELSTRDLGIEDVAPGAERAGQALPRVADHETLGELGRGAMGIVLKARQISLNRVVALKLIQAGARAGAEDRARFRAEAEAVAHLQHPNIVQVYAVGEQDGWPYFSLELVEGGSLAERIAGTPQPARQAAQLVETLARAMQAAHQRGVIHRDLKPANVLLTADGTPKITDFGLAKRLEQNAGHTRTGAVVGTPSYMAPEQAAGKARDVGPAADIYALGAILYELLAGRPPFRAETVLDTLDQVRSQEPVPPTRLQPKVPRDVETICLKCLHKEPAKRYASAGALADDLARFLRGEPILARPVGPVGRLWRWSRRNPRVAALLAVLLVVGVGSFATITGLLVRSEYHRGRAEGNLEEANRQRQRAVANLVQARQAVDRYMTLVGQDPRLRDHDLAELRRKLLQSARDYYLIFVRQSDDDPEIRAELGKAYGRLAEITQEVGTAAEAIALCQECRGIFERLVGDQPDVAGHQSELASCHNRLGALYRATGQTEQALEAHGQALALFDRLARDHPADPAYQAGQAGSYQELGNAYHAARQLDRAEAAYKKALDLRGQLTREYPSTPEYRGDVARSQFALGNVYRLRKQFAEAEAACQEALEIQQGLASEHPRVIGCQQDLARSHNLLAVVYSETRRPDLAEKAYEKALAVHEELARKHPSVTQFAVELGTNYQNLGRFTNDNRKPEVAMGWYDRAVRTLEAVLQKDPQHVPAKQVLCRAHQGRAGTFFRLRRHEEALKDWDRAIDLAEEQAREPLYISRALSLAWLGEHARATADADRVASPASASSNTLYNAGCVYARSSEMVRKDTRVPVADRDQLAERYAVRAVALLRRAWQKGEDVTHLATDKFLPSLQSRADFQQLQGEIQDKAKRKPN
jgi:serine/threonine-protein kinase